MQISLEPVARQAHLVTIRSQSQSATIKDKGRKHLCLLWLYVIMNHYKGFGFHNVLCVYTETQPMFQQLQMYLCKASLSFTTEGYKYTNEKRIKDGSFRPTCSLNTKALLVLMFFSTEQLSGPIEGLTSCHLLIPWLATHELMGSIVILHSCRRVKLQLQAHKCENMRHWACVRLTVAQHWISSPSLRALD